MLTLKKHRPLKKSIVNKLCDQFSIEMTYNSNAIEGNQLTLKETYLVLGRLRVRVPRIKKKLRN